MKYKTKNGFTMIEIIFSISILAFVFLAVMMSYTQNNTVTRASKTSITALNLARQRVEYLKKWEYLQIGRTSTDYVNFWNVYPSPAPSLVTIDNVNYSISTNFIIPANYNNDLNNTDNIVPIKVTVSWLLNNKNKSVTLTTYYTSELPPPTPTP